MDVDPFVHAVIFEPFNLRADMNDDGSVTGLDVAPLLPLCSGKVAAFRQSPSPRRYCSPSSLWAWSADVGNGRRRSQRRCQAGVLGGCPGGQCAGVSCRCVFSPCRIGTAPQVTPWGSASATDQTGCAPTALTEPICKKRPLGRYRFSIAKSRHSSTGTCDLRLHPSRLPVCCAADGDCQSWPLGVRCVPMTPIGRSSAGGRPHLASGRRSAVRPGLHPPIGPCQLDWPERGAVGVVMGSNGGNCL